ncbi:MAG TPA: hypothetical protein VIR45_08025 [Kiloniellaceae bacterium]
MPDSIFDGVVVLDSFQREGSLTRLRFVPEVFEVGLTDPVLLVDIRSHAEAGEVTAKVAIIQRNSIIDIRVDPQTVEVWLARADPPVTFRGTVTWSYEGYTLSDYARIVEERDRAANSQIRHLRATLDRAVGFVDRAIDRAERKEGASTPGSDRFAKEAQLLRSVRRQLTED